MGNAQITLKISLLMNVINVVGNAIGVYVLKLGVAGVAIPSLVSRGVAGVVLLRFCIIRTIWSFSPEGKFKVDATIVKRILFIGIPSGIENGIFQLGRVLVVSIIVAFGTSQIAANGVANSLDSMGCIVGQAMSLAMITVIGRCVGSRRRRTGALLHQKSCWENLFLYGGHQQHHFTSAAVDFTDLWTGRGERRACPTFWS